MEIDDTWTRRDPETGARVRSARWGSGKRWRARWRDDDGRRHSRSFATRDEAEAEVAAIVGDMARGRYIDPELGSLTFGDYAERWFAAREYSPLTRVQTRYRMDLHVLPYFGRRRLRDVKPSTVQAWNVELREKGLSGTTRALLHGFVLSVFASAVDDGLIPRNPAAGKTVRPPRRERPKVEPWTLERVRAMHEAMPERWRILVALGAMAGLRQGETFGLALEDIDWQARELRVRRQVLLFPSTRAAFALPKYEKERTVPVGDVLLDELQRHLERFPAREVTLPWRELDGDPVTARLVATSREGGPGQKNYVSRSVWGPALERAGIPRERSNGSHALRHHYASSLLAAGEGILVVAERLGHADPAFTLRTYTHLMPGSEQRTRDVVDALWRPPAAPAAEAATADAPPRPAVAPPTSTPARRAHLRVVK